MHSKLLVTYHCEINMYTASYTGDKYPRYTCKNNTAIMHQNLTWVNK